MDGMNGAGRAADPVDPHAHRIVFQPLVAVADRVVVGYEALARFDDGRAPLEHLREAGAGRRALELALARSAVAAARSLSAEKAVTINLSAEVIAGTDVCALLDSSRRWGVELTESTGVADADAVVAEVRARDAMLLVDDAGTGYAQLSRVRELRPDVVKIDKSLLWAAADTGDTSEIAAFLQVSGDIGARTLAEGVETEAHHGLIAALGIDYAQGFLYGRPGDAAG